MTTELETCNSGSCSTETTPETTHESFVKPQFTAKEVDGAYEVGVIMPGVSRDGVDVNLDKGVLTITGKVKRDVPETWRVLHRELTRDDYRLRLELNFEYDDGGITAKVEDGVLSLRLPVAEEAKPKEINVE